MGKASEVVLYGANGYTGKLISESLHERGVPFIAAGRNQQKLENELKIVAKRAGVDKIDAEIRTVAHNLKDLTDLFASAKVVINVTGPFAQIGESVVEAALNAECHYLDTTGEQDFIFEMRDKFGAAFAAKNLLLSPACAYMWSMGALATEVCLEKPGIDTIELAYVSENGVPSVASTRSFLRMLVAEHYYLQENELVEWDKAVLHDTKIRTYNTMFRASPWGGGAEPVWYQHDARVQNCRVVFCADNKTLDLVRDTVEDIIEQSEGQPVEMREAAANLIADTITPVEPEKEDPRVHRATIACEARGTITQTSCYLVMHSPYVVTGELIAEGVTHLLGKRLAYAGFQPIVKVIGHRQLLGTLADKGFLSVIEN